MKIHFLELKASQTRKETWWRSAVNFDRRDSDKPCMEGTISFDGVGDSWRENNVLEKHTMVHNYINSKYFKKNILQMQTSAQSGQELAH